MAVLPLVLVVIDGWSPHGPRPWDGAHGHLPHFQRLARHGSHGVAVTTFPGVTPTALATLMTGSWPDRHKVPGILWYHREEDRHIHYWPSWEQARAGHMGRVARDILVDLNRLHLDRSTPTIVDTLETAGIRCAIANLPIHRGPVPHHARMRFPLDPLFHRGRLLIEGPSGILLPGLALSPFPGRRPGWGESHATSVAAAWLRSGCFGLVVLYLPSTDLTSHRLGPPPSAPHWQRTDGLLGRLMQALGGPRNALERARWLLLGDHGQSSVEGSDKALAPERLWRDLDPVPLGKGGLGTRHALALSPNDRSLLVTTARGEAGAFAAQEAWRRLQHLPGVDVAARRTPEGDLEVVHVPSGYRLRARPGGRHLDPWGGRWHLDGNPEALDLRADGAILREHSYPAALQRLWSGTQESPLAASARPGWEFTTGTPMGKGNHGSLHACDSWTPTLTVGLDVPARTTLASLAPYIVRACLEDR
ncbi:MAG: alkaline phosphatase family protein [Candidatus Sericytochromatia bacterium]|nr:alkaline phosphatase family protein [Candidatus Sericytochromatia bacterium]